MKKKRILQKTTKEKKDPIAKKESSIKTDKKYIQTNIPGFDSLLEKGIPKGSSILIAGGAGSGKTIFCLQTAYNQACQGKKCFYMSFEETAEKLKQHIQDFGWDMTKTKNNLQIEQISPFEIARSVDALMMQTKGELLIDLEPILLPNIKKPDFIFFDSLTAVGSTFIGKEDAYRIYIEQLFRFFEKIGATSFLITETKQVPTIFSETGTEEFLADGVFVFYAMKHGNVREKAIEVLKLRGGKHEPRIVAMEITNKGIKVYPEQEIFSEFEKEEE